MPTGTQVLTDIQYQRRIARKSKIFKKKKLVPKPLQVTHFRRYARLVLDKRLYVPPHIQRSYTRICRNKFGASRSTVVKRLRNLLEEPGCLLTSSYTYDSDSDSDSEVWSDTDIELPDETYSEDIYRLPGTCNV